MSAIAESDIKPIRILSLDGGGVKGILVGSILDHIEFETGKPIRELFDVISGTSTGALMAAGLTFKGSQGVLSASQMCGLYSDESCRIFRKRFGPQPIGLDGVFYGRYSSDGINKILNNIFGDSRISDLSEDRVNVIISSYNLTLNRPAVFASSDAIGRDFKNYMIRDVIMSSCSAPTFFDPHIMDYSIGGRTNKCSMIDGGVYVNNPSMNAVVEVGKQYGSRKIFMLSIGTGFVNKIRPPSVIGRPGWVGWGKILTDLFIDGASKNTDYHAGKIVEMIKGGKYYRWNPSLAVGQEDLDNVDKDNLSGLVASAQSFLSSHKREISHVCSLLSDMSKR